MVSRMGGRGGLVWAMTMTRYQLRRKGRGWEGLGGSLRRSSRWGSRRSRSGAKGRTRENGGSVGTLEALAGDLEGLEELGGFQRRLFQPFETAFDVVGGVEGLDGSEDRIG